MNQEEKDLTELIESTPKNEQTNIFEKKPAHHTQSARIAGYKEKWRAYPENKPRKEMKCLAELWYKESEHTTLKYLWCVYWNGSMFRDYGGNTDIQDGAIVKYFITDEDLGRPKTT
jgi:hypothetical protein